MVFTKKLLFTSFVIALLYILLVIYGMNFFLINTELSGAYPLFFKVKVLVSLIGGLTTSMTTVSLVLLTINALLTWLTLSLTIQKVKSLRKMENVHVVAGGSSLIGIVSGGCVSCGLPLLSILGLSGSLLYLPFKGQELPYISLFLLAISLLFLVRTDRKGEMCEVPRKK